MVVVERCPAAGRALALGIVVQACMLVGWLAGAPPALAATFVVNRTDDVADPNLGDGRCDVDLAAAGDQCTLRAAIQQANAAPAIPSAAHRIELPTGVVTLTIPGRDEDNAVTGDLDVRGTAVQIVGQGATRTTVAAGQSFGTTPPVDRVLHVHGGASVVLENLTISNGDPGPNRSGGGILNDGALRIVGVEVRQNRAQNGNDQPGGGGISSGLGGTLTVLRSTIADNAASNNGAGVANQGTATIEATTITGNRTPLAGGGVFSFTQQSTRLRSVTLVANEAGGQFGGGIAVSPGTRPIDVSETILDNPVGRNCLNASDTRSEGFNIASDGACALGGPADLANTPPGLGPLALNGGETRSFVPRPDSPALNGGGSTCGATTPDQRGLARPPLNTDTLDTRCDVGAVEVPTLVVAATGDPRPLAAPSAACRTGAAGCSLRQAVLDGNAYGGATVLLPSGTLTLALAGRDEDAGATGDLDVLAPIAVQGSFTAPTIVQAGTSQAAAIDRVFHVHSGAQLVLSDLTVRFGRAVFTPLRDDGNGGAILALGPLTVRNAAIRDSAAERLGGGIATEVGAPLVVRDSTIEGNRAPAGGGILGRAQATIERSLIADNVASSGFGGGVLLSPAGNTGPARIALSTFGRNQGLGGAALSVSATSQAVELTRLTVADNAVTDVARAALEVETGGALTMRGVLVAENPGPNCRISAATTAGGDNLSDDATCNVGANTRLNTDPLLGQLRNNGGRSRTHALLPGSPAIDTGSADAAVCTVTGTDQRGQGGFFFTGRADGDEVAGARCDVGAFEVQRYAVSAPDDLVSEITFSDGACLVSRPGGIETVCSLREAIKEANLQGHAVVGLPAGTYTLTRSGAGENAGLTGDLDVTGAATILGASAATTFVQAGTAAFGGIDRALEVRPSAIAHISGVTFRNGRVVGNGGGLLNGGTLTLTDVGIEASMARGSPSSGGGLAAEGGASITTLQRVLVADNRAERDGTSALPRGGGIGAEAGTLRLENVTVSGNVGFVAGGIFAAARTELVNVTLASNSASESGTGNDLFVSTTTTTVSNTIFASGTVPCRVSVGGQLVSRGYNISSGFANEVGCAALTATGDRTQTGVALGALAANGGQTRTRALLNPATNPAVDGGNPATPLDGRNGRCAAVDQRNRARPRDGSGGKGSICDVGAFEVQPAFTVGAFDVRLDAGAATPGAPLGVRFAWEVPEPLVWRDLEALSLRLVDERGRVVFWLRWTERDDRFALLDEDGRERAGGAPGSATVLRTDAASLDLRGVRVEGSGPTGRSATLHLPLVFSEAAAGRSFRIEVSARGDDGAEDPFAEAGTIRVAASEPPPPSPQPPDDDGDDKEKRERPRKPTEEQRHQRQRTNRSGLDDARIEGNVVAVDRDASPPTVTIGARDGLVVLQVRGEAATVTVKVGDYVTAEGEKVHEGLYEVDSLDAE